MASSIGGEPGRANSMQIREEGVWGRVGGSVLSRTSTGNRPQNWAMYESLVTFMGAFGGSKWDENQIIVGSRRPQGGVVHTQYLQLL